MQKALEEPKKHHYHFIKLALKKMEFWMPHIDYSYFDKITKEELSQFIEECKLITKNLEEISARSLLKDENDILTPLRDELQLLQEKTQTIAFETLKVNRF